MENDIEDEDITAEGEVGFGDDGKNKRKNGLGKRPSSGRDTSPPRCQADKCGLDLSDAKRYHRRHKVCEVHAKAPVVILAGLRQRFCQQCSRFHELMEFDETKRSCRRRLAGHNERRRKSSGELYGEAGPSCKAVVVDPRLKTTKEVVAGQWRELADHHERGSSGGGGGVHNNHMMMSQGNPSNYKHFHIR